MTSTRRAFLKSAAIMSSMISGCALTIDNPIVRSNVLSSKRVYSASGTRRSNADWFKDAKWGVFCHYLVNKDMRVDDWNRRVDSFNTANVTDQLESVGAKYFFFTIGQNSGHYCSPNSTYDSIVGINPSKCSRRDLIGDLYGALSPRGIKLLVYLPSGAPAEDRVAVRKLQWEWGFEGGWPKWNTKRTGKRLAEFQKMWEAIIREWSIRWGNRVSGWWIDGCYFPDEMYNHPDPPNFQSLAAALKAGNPDGIVAFNPSVKTPVISMTEYEDYTAGEISDAFPVCPGRWIEGAQYHTLSYLGENWSRGNPRFVDGFVTGFTEDVNSKGGVVTWDVPLSATGEIPEEYVVQLKELNRVLSSRKNAAHMSQY
jgi:hypothetical protein